jgi:Uma2 family endonuclease
MAIGNTVMTADELWELPEDHQRHKLVKEELRTMARRGEEHGSLTVNVIVPLSQHVCSNRLGRVYGELGCKLEVDPDTVRAPDVAFVRQERLDALGRVRGYWPGAPDLVVEVLSPGNTAVEINDRMAICMANGCSSFWVVDPIQRRVSATEGNVTHHYDAPASIPCPLLGGEILVSAIFE